jgi:O-antigen ligase
VALMLLAAFMLASIGERYTWPMLPVLIGTAVVFLLSGARVGADPLTRSLDFILIAALGVIALQMIPLPLAIVRIVSPSTPAVQDVYALQPFASWRPLSIHPAATHSGFALAFAAALMFWTSREAFSRGGSRVATRVLAWIGFGCALVSLAQRATAPKTVLWKWSVPDPRAVPFGFFVDRNQLAMWLILAISLVVGYVAMHVHARMRDGMAANPRGVLVALSDAGPLTILGCAGVMVLTLAATLSRSGFLGIIGAALVGASLSRGDRKRVFWIGAAAAVALGAVAASLNLEGFAQRVVTTIGGSELDTTGRLTIWRETLRIVRDFPLLGTGVGTFADTMFVYQQTAREVLFNNAHNEYLQLLTEGGAVLLILGLTGLVFLVKAARARLAGDAGAHRFLRVGACAALTGVAVQSIWEAGLRAPANLLLAAIVAAIAVRPIHRTSDSATEITPA